MAEIDTSLQHIRTELERQGTTVRDLVQQLDEAQKDNRKMRNTVKACIDDQRKFELKLAELKDRSRKNNIRIIGLKEGSEKDDPVGFLQKQLPKWIPSLQNRATIEIDRAHRIYGKGPGTRTLILRCLRYQDRQAIIQGARKVQPECPIRDSNATLRFKPDNSTLTIQRHQECSTSCMLKASETFLLIPQL